MEHEIHVRQACEDNVQWIVDLSARAQESLTAAGSLQEIGPLPLQAVDISVRGGFAFLLEVEGKHIGSVLVEPLDGNYPNTQTVQYVHWGVQSLPGPLWYLQSLMLEPVNQGKGLGLIFLEGVLRLMNELSGTIILDCWAGNIKLREFYERAGFLYHGDFSEKDYEISVYLRNLGK